MNTSAKKFLESARCYGWEQYRDGFGYQVELLEGLPESQANLVLDWLSKLSAFDWPHAEVFDAIPGERSTQLLIQALGKPNLRVCLQRGRYFAASAAMRLAPLQPFGSWFFGSARYVRSLVKDLRGYSPSLLPCWQSKLLTTKCLSLCRQTLSFRMAALAILLKRNAISQPRAEDIICSALKEMSIMNGMSAVHSMVEKFNTPRVRAIVLDNALHGNDEIRVHSAALSHFLNGITTSPFDKTHWAFYLEFNKPMDLGRKQAFAILCQQIEEAKARKEKEEG